ncbi:MAG: nucleotidyltransferase family protein [Verrucomicrobia bacterium]|nr:nucleotidyltransferase family protein [Verrucomicrobiota bacterium]
MFPVNLLHHKATGAGLAYLVIGGHAVNYYCEPRATLDVDFLVRRDDQSGWRALLQSEGFKLLHEQETFLQFSPPYGVEWRLDLMLVNEPTFAKLAAGARCEDLLGVRTLIPRPEHLIALKLHSLKHGHQERFEKDFGDVLALTRNTGLDLKSESVRELFDQFGTRELYERVLQRLG